MNHSLKGKDTDHHHEQIPIVQKTFIVHVKNMTDIIEELNNPFADTSDDLFALDSKQIMSNSVVDAIKSTEDIGEAQYHTFLKERLYNNTIDFSGTILKNNLSLLCSGTQKKTEKYTSNLSNLNDDISLFSRMYVSCQARGSDMDNFFKHENHAWPPSLASNGIMHQTNKFDLMECLESLAPQPDNIPDVDVGIIDFTPLYGCEIWMPSGHGTKKRYIPCQLISQVLGSDVAWRLLLLHGFSGCDIV